MGDWYDAVYISEDDQSDPSDDAVRSVWNGTYTPLAPAANYTISENVTIPSRLTPGDKYLILRVDYNQNQTETDETNNTIAVPIRLQAPDLRPTDLTAPGNVASDQEVTFTWNVVNEGAHAALGYWGDALYVSADEQLDWQDKRIGYVFHSDASPVDAGSSYEASGTFRLNDVQPGNKFIILNVDDDGLQSETDEADNLLIRPITIDAPDLVVTTVNAPATIDLGHAITVSWTVTNVGTVSAFDDWQDRFSWPAGPLAIR